MSTPRGLGQNGGHFYSNITQPVKIDMSFVVNSAVGLGIASLKSNGYVRNVFMHTSTTPAANDGYTNPNPASGYVLIQLKNNFKAFLGLNAIIQPPTTGSALTSTTANVVCVINALGTATLANWQAVGLPPGITPAVGVSFCATASQSIGGSASVKVPAVSGISDLEVVGNPNVMLNNSAIASNGGAWLLGQFVTASAGGVTSTLTMDSYTPAGVITNGSPDTFAGTPAVLTGSISNSGSTAIAIGAPADGSIITLSAYYDVSSVTIDGL